MASENLIGFTEWVAELMNEPSDESRSVGSYVLDTDPGRIVYVDAESGLWIIHVYEARAVAHDATE